MQLEADIKVDIKELLRRVDFLPIVERDIPALAGTFNGQMTHEVPCPKCGGRTRARFRLCSDGRQRFYCSHCAEKGLDAIAYFQWRDGMAWRDAFDIVHELAGTPGAAIATTQPTRSAQPEADHAPGATWQAKARTFVAGCADYLWTPAGAAALEYLRARKLTDDTIKRAGLGYNPTKRTQRGPLWGLSDNTTVAAVVGIVIPRFILGELWAVNIRRMIGGKPYSGPDKYICVTGSKLGLWGADSLAGARVCITFGGELDAILASQYAWPGLAVVSFGGEGRTIKQPWRNMLNNMNAVYVCLDNDDAGDQGAVKWAVIDKARRVRVPRGKDLTEYAQIGGDVAAWLDGATGTDLLLERAFTWAETKGYTVTLGINAHWQLSKDEEIETSCEVI